MLAIDAEHDQLRDHRVVDTGDLVAGGDAGVDAHARARRLAVRRDPTGRGQKALRSVLRVDAALDRMAAKLDVCLVERQPLAAGDPDLFAYEVDARHLLRHGVLDLDARVHFHEEILAVASQQPLDRSRRAIPGRSCRVDADPADEGTQLAADRGRRRLLDQLLVPALNRAVALAEVDHVAVRVCEYLHLDVPRVDDQLLDVDLRVGKVSLPLAPRRLECALG